MTDWKVQEAINPTIFREINEWTDDGGGGGRDAVGRPMGTYLCECGDAGCFDPIKLTSSEYEGVRSEPTRFALAVNHENPEIDSVITENERFATIERSFGLASRIARAFDPRRQTWSEVTRHPPRTRPPYPRRSKSPTGPPGHR